MFMEPSDFNKLYSLHARLNEQMRRQNGILCLSNYFLLLLERTIKPCFRPKLLRPSQHVSGCDSVRTHYMQEEQDAKIRY